MEIFEELLNKAQESYKAGKFERAYELMVAAVKYLRGVLDAKKLTTTKAPGQS